MLISERQVVTKMNIFREETTSALAGFHAGASILVELEFGDAGFVEEKSSEQRQNQQQTQTTYRTGLEWSLGHIGGR